MSSTTTSAIHYISLLFKKEGAPGVRKILVESVRKKRSIQYTTEQVDDICGLGDQTPGPEKLPSWKEVERNAELMNGFLFSLVSPLFDLRPDRILRVDQRIKALTEENYHCILKDMTLNGYGAKAAAGGTAIDTLSSEMQVVPFVVFRIFDELG